jgi:outer membrane lipoprotein-sorting protein
MIPRRGAAAALVLTALLAAGACQPVLPPPVTSSGLTVSTEEVVAALAAGETAVRTVRGLADVRLQRGEETQRLREAAVLSLPDKLRMETLQFGGFTALVVASNGEELQVYSPTTREFARGRASARALAGLTGGVAVEPAHLVRLLAGLAPLPFPAADPRSRLEPDGEGFVAESVAGPYTQRLALDGAGTLLRAELRDATGPLFQAYLQEHRQIGGRPFPYRVRLERPGVGAIEVVYQSVELNGLVDPAIFTLALPEGDVRVVDLDALVPR